MAEKEEKIVPETQEAVKEAKPEAKRNWGRVLLPESL